MKKMILTLSILGILFLGAYREGWYPIDQPGTKDPATVESNSGPGGTETNFGSVSQSQASPIIPADNALPSAEAVPIVVTPENKSSVQPPAVTREPAKSPQQVQSPSIPAKNSQQEMLGYINSERAKIKLAPLTLSGQLSDGAYLKSKDMAVKGYFEHNSPTYGTPFAMMKSLGITYRTAAENIAFHQSVLSAHNAFMNSPGHRANILNPAFHKLGLGIYMSGSDFYITQWFTD